MALPAFLSKVKALAPVAVVGGAIAITVKLLTQQTPPISQLLKVDAEEDIAKVDEHVEELEPEPEPPAPPEDPAKEEPEEEDSPEEDLGNEDEEESEDAEGGSAEEQSEQENQQQQEKKEEEPVKRALKKDGSEFMNVLEELLKTE